MNNQFATQFLLSEEQKASDVVKDILDQLGADEELIAYFVKAVELGYLTPERAIEIFKSTLKEMTGSGAVGGGSTTGGGTTAGATFTPGAGEQYASTKAFKGTRKKKYQEGTFDSKEHIAIFSGPDGTANVYKLSDGTYYAQVEGDPDYDMTAKDATEMAAKLKKDGLTKRISGGLEEDMTEKEPLEIGDRVKVIYGNQFYGHTGTIDDVVRGFVVVDIDGEGTYSMHSSDVKKIEDEEDDEMTLEDAPRLAGDPAKTTSQGAKNLSAYSSVGFTKAPSAEEAGKKIKGVQVKMLWKEGEQPAWEAIEKYVQALAQKQIPTHARKEYVEYMKNALAQGLISKPEDLYTSTSSFIEMIREGKLEEAAVPENIEKFAKRKGITHVVNKVARWAEKAGKKIVGGTAIGKDYNTLILDLTHQGSEIYINCEEETIEVKGKPVGSYEEFVAALNSLNESRAYSQFKRQAATRSKDQQMHEAVKMIHSKLEEVSKLVEFAQQMRTELSEGENALEYKHNTKKIFEKINSKVVEVYTKTRDLK